MKIKGAGDITPFIERRQYALQRFLRRMVSHPILVVDENVVGFFETDTKMYIGSTAAPTCLIFTPLMLALDALSSLICSRDRAVDCAGGLCADAVLATLRSAESGLERTSHRAKPASSLLASMAAKVTMYFETDEYFDDRMKQNDVLGAQLGRLHKSIESLVSIRRGLSISTTKFAETFAALADAEELKHLTQAMHQLADVEAKVAKFHMKQSSRDYFEFSETIYDYMLLVGSCKVAMVQRQEVNKLYLAAVQALDTKKKREAAIKADPKKSALKEKVDAAAQEVKEAEARVKKVHSPLHDFRSPRWAPLPRMDALRRFAPTSCLRYPLPHHELHVVRSCDAVGSGLTPPRPRRLS